MSNEEERSQFIRQLADLLNDKGLTEIEFDSGEWKVRVAKQGTPLAATYAQLPAAQPAPASGPAPAQSAPVDDNATHPGAVTSPMVGVVYLRPDPDSSPFITEGETVTQGQTLLLIEAMKVYNPIHAPKGGVIKKILVEGGSPVEFGEPLVIIE